MIGQTISHYRIIDRVGAGGMGVVYKAEDLNLERIVALKFLPRHAVGGGEERVRFVREAQAAAVLDHPNICAVHEIDETDEQMFIVMSYVDGGDLASRINEGALSGDQILTLSIQIAEGLREAHAKHIVHRDVKSANILLTSDGQVKITDFGLAKLLDRSRITRTGVALGTLHYMSPEQTKGEVVDGRVDIWALGVVMYEMCTGRLPFKGDNLEALIYSILNEDPAPVAVPVEIETIVRRALTKDREARYQTLDEMLGELRAVRSALERGELAERPSPGHLRGLWQRIRGTGSK